MKKNKHSVKILSLILVLVMAFSLVPVSASAESYRGGSANTNGWSSWWNWGWGGWWNWGWDDPEPEPEPEPEEPVVEEPTEPEEPVVEEPVIETSFTTDVNGLAVNVETEEGAFTEPVSLSVSAIEADSSEYASAEAALNAKGMEYDGMLAFDIHFNSVATGDEVEPNGEVTVTMDVTSGELSGIPADAADSIVVTHIAEDGAEVVATPDDTVPGTVDVTVADDSVQALTADFGVNSFSTFTVTWKGGNSSATQNYYTDLTFTADFLRSDGTVRVYYVDLDQKYISRPSDVDSKYTITITTGTTTVDPTTYAKDIPGYEYDHVWYLKDDYFYAMTSLDVKAEKYGSSYYPRGYYKNDDTTVENPWLDETSYGIYLFYKRTDTPEDNKLTVHHGIIEGGTFKEFGTGDLPATSNTGNYPTSLDISNYSSDNPKAYLIYDFAGYRYKETRFVDNVNGATNPSTAGTQVWPILNRATTYSGDAYWQYRVYGTTSWTTLQNDGRHIYVIYEKKEVAQGYDPESGGDEPGGQQPEPEKPDVSKQVGTMKPDGTYDITLSVTGKSVPVEKIVKANIIVVFDISGSMDDNIDGESVSYGEKSRLQMAKDAVNAMAEKILAKEKDGQPLAQMALITFGTKASKVEFGSNNYFTSNYDKNDPNSFVSKVNALTANGGGTNWEDALDLANSLAGTTPNAPTHIVFVSDGDPTFRISRGDYSDTGSAGIYQECYNNNSDHTYYARDGIFGAGDESNFSGGSTNARCLAAAKAVAASIHEAKKSFYSVGLSSDATKMQELAEAGSGEYLPGDDAEQFAENMDKVADKITNSFDFTDISVTDGVTSMSQVATQALIGNAGNFVYKKDGEIWEGAPTATLDTDTNAVTWDLSEVNESPDNDPAKKGILTPGVVYSVTFTVWPKQEAYDLIADLDNGVRKITDSDMDDLTKQQLIVKVGGTPYEYNPETGKWGNLTDAELQAMIDNASSVSFSMKTNTGLTASYSFNGDSTTTPYTNYVNGEMSLDATTIGIHKHWANAMDTRDANFLTGEGGYIVDREGNFILDGEGNKIGYWETEKAKANGGIQYIDLRVTRNGVIYLDNVRLYSDQDWKLDNLFISCGAISRNGNDLVVREAGYEYTVAEKPDDSYYWELTSDVYHPMVINGVTTMLIKVEDTEDLPDSVKNLGNNKMIEAGGKTYYKFPAKSGDTEGTLFVVGSAPAMLEALNSRRSVLNITKAVDVTTNVGYDEDTYFTYTIKMENTGLKYPGQPGYNAKDTDGFWFCINDSTSSDVELKDESLVLNDSATAEYKNDAFTGYWYFDNGGTVTVKIKAGWNIHFINLLSTTTYQIDEVPTSMPEGYVLKNVAATANPDDADAPYAADVNGSVINGAIANSNTKYTVTYTNDFLGYFYVYHSANNNVQRFPMAENGVKYEAGKKTFNIAELTDANSLYGGYYKDYAGKSDGFDAKTLAYTDNWATDNGGTAYSYAYINTCKTNNTPAWTWDNGYDAEVGETGGGVGTAMTPVANQVYFLKEVPTGYLKPYNHYTYYKATNKMASMWAITALDDTCYQKAYFLITDVETGATVANSVSIKAANSKTSTKLTAEKMFGYTQGVQAGYVGYAKISDKIGSKIVMEQYWLTKDGVAVHGTVKRTLDTSADAGRNMKGTAVFSDDPYQP